MDDLVLGGPGNSFLYQMHVNCIASVVFKATSSEILSNRFSLYNPFSSTEWLYDKAFDSILFRLSRW